MAGCEYPVHLGGHPVHLRKYHVRLQEYPVRLGKYHVHLFAEFLPLTGDLVQINAFPSLSRLQLPLNIAEVAAQFARGTFGVGANISKRAFAVASAML